MLTDAVAAQRSHIAALEKALWRDPADTHALHAYQAAYRELEALIARQGVDTRHSIVIVIPVADSPHHLRACMDSVLTQCRTFGYGGMRNGRYCKVRVLLADDSADATAMKKNRRIVDAAEQAGLSVDYFGLEQQQTLLQRLRDINLRGIVGEHPADDLAHKGQGVMRNIAFLRLAELQAQAAHERLLFYTIDADQRFAVNVPGAEGGATIQALNYFDALDRLFSDGDIQVLTGKVVGDPPVSPAVMAGNFLDDALAFVSELYRLGPGAGYRQPPSDTRGSGEAAYHDMADLFGFASDADAHRYRCRLPGTPSNAACFAEFARRLNGFFHGEHPTRVSWYRHRPLADSVQPARTVYTGNYAFSAAALERFIPFAPLRLRMSGPTMGRMLQAELGAAFASANLPMLHRRTLAATGSAEFRPGVTNQRAEVDLADEFERQFHGDVMLFAMQRLMAGGQSAGLRGRTRIAAVLETVQGEMRTRYREKQQAILARVERLESLLDDPLAWWSRESSLADAVTDFAAFAANIRRNFGRDSPTSARLDSAVHRARWRARQLDAIVGLDADRAAWRRALALLGHHD